MNEFSTDNSDSSKKTGAFSNEFIAESPALKDLLDVAKSIARVNSPVLIMGEHGSGKSLFAKQIFLYSVQSEHSERRERTEHNECGEWGESSSKPFVSMHCASFGSESSFSALADEATGGVALLRNVECLSRSVQNELLALLQKYAVRVIATTSCNLNEMAARGEFSEELYFRLNALSVRIPPLRERREDILPIALRFLNRCSVENGKIFEGFSKQALSDMYAYRWHGNVRELGLVVARACIIGTANEILSADLRLPVPYEKADDSTEIADVVSANESGDRSLKKALDTFKRAYIIKILEECNWNQTKASKVLKIQRTYVSRLILELNIRESK